MSHLYALLILIFVYLFQDETKVLFLGWSNESERSEGKSSVWNLFQTLNAMFIFLVDII